MTSETTRHTSPSGDGAAGPAGPAPAPTEPSESPSPSTGLGQAASATSGEPADGPASVLTCASCGKRNRIRPSARGAPHCGSCDAPLPWIVSAADGTFDVEVRAAVTVLVDLWAPWCGPCRVVSPMLEELGAEFAGRLKVIKVNVDDNPALAQRFGAMSIPTLVVIRDGRVVDRLVGGGPKDAAEGAAHAAPPAAMIIRRDRTGRKWADTTVGEKSRQTFRPHPSVGGVSGGEQQCHPCDL